MSNFYTVRICQSLGKFTAILNQQIIHGDMKENVSGCFFSEHSVYVCEHEFCLHFQNLSILGYIHCNFCLNPQIIHGDMKENLSGCFFLNTVYISLKYDDITIFKMAVVCHFELSKLEIYGIRPSLLSDFALLYKTSWKSDIRCRVMTEKRRFRYLNLEFKV